MVFIHGLNGHRELTWTADNGIMWPRDLLAGVVPTARILGFGYDSRTHSLSGGLAVQTVHGHSTTLLQTLSVYRRSTEVRAELPR
jgi:hypothetical protein